MVVLKNIQRTKSEIEADYYPEGKGPKSHMKLNFVDGTVIEHKGNENSMSPVHVRKELMRMAKAETLPEERTIVWY